jgi:hypothetical protein
VRPGRWAREIFSLLGFILPKESFTVGFGGRQFAEDEGVRPEGALQVPDLDASLDRSMLG